MLKLHFFDGRGFEILDGFTRKLEQPRKFEGNPILVSDHSTEGNRLAMYGSVIRRPEDGLWQMWYTVGAAERGGLAYAESEDGVRWRRPALDVVKHPQGPSHLVFDRRPHGAAVLYDTADKRPGWRYKLLTGAAPSDRISAFRSSDGIHWIDAAENPVIGINPDCPMSFHRADDGRFVLYCRPQFGDRRVSRRESWDLVHWSEPKIVIDQDPSDHLQTQFYGLGAVPYGPYELGTLWIYHTCEDDYGFNKMHGRQEPELVYTRSGYAWHRAELGTPWIPLGEEGSWDWGSIQIATAPVFLEDEIRYYYVGRRQEHGVTRDDGHIPTSGIGFASLQPDRFFGVTARDVGRILTRPFWTAEPEFFVNARVRSSGEIRAELQDVSGAPIEGYELANCIPVEGDSTRHRLSWRGAGDGSKLTNREIRLHLQVRGATVYALAAGREAELSTYWQFRLPEFLTIQQLKDHGMWRWD